MKKPHVSAARPIPVGFLRHPAHLLALGFGTGCAPLAPGTAGTVFGVLVYLALQAVPVLWYLVVTVVLFGVGVLVCHRAAEALGSHDHPAIVWDEVVGYLVAMTAAPDGWVWIVFGFVLFRAFDIFKPWPIRTIDARVSGGVGIMLDDAAAGLYAFLVMQVTGYLTH
ncbi:MAG: phosphatidylglycerophosphatase A [Chromatiales bacterium]